MKYPINIYLIIFAALFLQVYKLNAQDTLVKTNNSHIIAKIIEINPKTIKYKNFANQDGPVIIIDRKNVARIIYTNGDVDTINVKFHPLAEKPPKPPKPPKPDLRKADYGKNHFSLVITDLFVPMASLGYERIFLEGRYSVKLPVSVGFKFNSLSDTINQDMSDNVTQDWVESGYYYEYKIFSTGIEFYYFTGGQQTFSYFIGPAFEYGLFNYMLSENHSPNFPTLPYRKEMGSYFAVMLKNGVHFQVNKNINLSINGGGGYYKLNSDYSVSSDYYPDEFFDHHVAVEFGITVGYRF